MESTTLLTVKQMLILANKKYLKPIKGFIIYEIYDKAKIINIYSAEYLKHYLFTFG